MKRSTRRAAPSGSRERLHPLRVLLVLGLLAALEAPVTRAEPEIDIERALQLANDVRPAVVRIQWRRRGKPADLVERHAVVVDPAGWLLLAGPRPSTEGTLAAVFEDGRAMRAEVWATDTASCLTLLRVHLVRLPPLTVRGAGVAHPSPPAERGPDDEAAAAASPRPGAARLEPPRLPPDSPFVMVTAEGAVSRGRLRGSHRRRLIRAPDSATPVRIACLDEAALSVVSTDLGAPWLDREGRIVGLLVGADIGSPVAESPTRLRPEVTAAYSIPGDVIRIVWPLLKVHRRVPRAALGAYVRRLSPATRQHVCPECGGFEVDRLVQRGAAERAGVEPQDIIRTVRGLPMAPDADLSDVLLPHRPGDRIRLGLLRRGEPVELEVVLGRAE